MKLAGLKCFTNGRSTGQRGCKFFPKNAKAHILVPYNWSVTVLPTDSDATIAAAVIADLKTKMVHNTYLSAAQLIGKYINYEDKSEAAVMQSFNLQKKTKIQRTKYMLEYQHDNGQDFHNVLLTFQGKEDSYKCLIVEDGGIIRGTNVYDSNGLLTAIAGIELDGIDVNDMKEGTPAAQAEFKWTLTYANANELNEDAFVIATGQNVYSVLDPYQVVDVQAIPFTATAARVHPVMLKTEAGDINLADTLGTALNDASIIASAVNDTSGVAIAVTSVAVNVATGKYVITFTAGAGYVAGQTATIVWGSVAAFHALGADYYRIRKTTQITMA
jgi:hypothetical protein